MPFARRPDLRYVRRGWYESVTPAQYVGTKGDVIDIVAGTRSNLASTPRIIWFFLPPTGVYEDSAFFHDELCNRLYRGNCHIPSRDVDGLFRLMIHEDQLAEPIRPPAWDFVVRWLMWTGVRIGALFNRHRRPGFLRDAPLVAAITVVTLSAVTLTAWGIDVAAHALIP